MPLLMIHAETADTVMLRKGEGDLATSYYRDGYRALSDEGNAKLQAAVEREDAARAAREAAFQARFDAIKAEARARGAKWAMR